MAFLFSSHSESEKEYDTSDGTSIGDLEKGRRIPASDKKHSKSKAASSTLNSRGPTKKQVDDDAVFCTRCRCIIVSTLVLVGVSVGVSLVLTNSANPLNYFIPVDPPGAKEATRWDAEKGLFLRVDIATDDLWAPVVEQSILDWNQTEAVVLTTNRVPHDPQCSPSHGRLKVCNDDYGETPWHGINIILVDQFSNTTVHSISKLNDRYNTDVASRRYIACHENGHGLGLPHTDEDHFNRDRGDCMDYTIRPERNGVPGDFNLNLLEELYGTPTRPRGSSDATNVNTAGSAANDAVSTGTGNSGGSAWDIFNKNPERENEDDEEEKEEDEDDRRRRLDLDDADVEEFERECSLRCKEEYCVYSYKHRYLVKINQFMAPQ